MAEGSGAEKALLASILGNAAICALKVFGGVLSGSAALLADGSDSLLNVVSGALAYRFKREAGKPPDPEHHYGHSLLEVYGSLLILMLMVATFSFIGFVAIDKLRHGVTGRVDPIGVPFAALSLGLNLTVIALLRVLGSSSAVVRTESRHVGLDVVESALTLAGVLLGAYVSALFDVAVAFVLLALVATFVAWTLRELKATITAESPSEGVVRAIRSALASVDGVKGIHDLRVRQVVDRVYADVHIEVDEGLSIKEAHRICDEAERKVRERLEEVDIVIHVEPKGGS